MAITYPPVELAKQMAEQYSIVRSIPETESWDNERFILALMGFQAGVNAESPDIKTISKFFKKTVDSMASALRITKEQVLSGKISLRAEWTDIFMTPQLINIWSRHKQVFKPDKDFADALTSTRKLQFTRNTFKHLPCMDFYIDLEDCPMFQNIHGLFLNIREDSIYDGMYINMLMLADAENTTEKYITFSHYVYVHLSKDGLIDLNMEEIINTNYEYWSPWLIEKNSMTNALAKLNKNEQKTLPFALGYQMIAYLSMDEPELTKNPVTKSTYKPRKQGTPVKNKFSEVQITDVGVRYGTDFRKKITKLENESKKVNRNAEDTSRSVKPHFRCAHWHYHRVGKGRNELKLMWHEPVFVAGKSGQDTSPDTVIHKIKRKD